MSSNTLEIRRLCVEFATAEGRLRAVDDVSLTLQRGEIVGLVGESGAGKSVTGAAVTGLIAPPGRITGGEIRLAGERIDMLPPRALRRLRGRRIGMTFQDPLASLDPLFTIGQQLVETIRTHRPMSRQAARSRARDLLAEVGLRADAARLDDYPHEFSGGMRQRVVIALALAGEPELLIADEPTSALDVSVQAQITRLFSQLCLQRKLAILLISHDMGVIAQTASRVAVMFGGRVVEQGDVAQVTMRPQHPYSAMLMSAIPPLHVRVTRLAQRPDRGPPSWDHPDDTAGAATKAPS